MLRSNLLMNCLWYEGITPEEFAAHLEMTPETLFRKLFQEEDFTEEEIRKIVELLKLNVEETVAIFGRFFGAQE